MMARVPRSAAAGHSVICAHCGVSFVLWPSQYLRKKSNRSITCSIACRRLHTQPVSLMCAFCGIAFNVNPSLAAVRKTCSRRCRSLLQSRDVRGKAHPRWVGGRFIDVNSGYVRVNCGDHTYRYEHRVVMERALGRSLTFDETIHHRNGNKTDNTLSNLELISRADHARRYHHRRIVKTVDNYFELEK